MSYVDGLEGANCRHRRYPFVEGISERTIRKQRRLRDAYKSAGLTEDAQTANIKLRRLNAKYKEFSDAAKLPEYSDRLKVLYIDDKSKAAAEALKTQRAAEAAPNRPMQRAAPNYSDVTAQWFEEATPNSHVVQDAQEYIKDGVTYRVDGHNVVLEPSVHEKEIAELLESTFGGELYMIPRVNNPQGVSTPDCLFRGLAYDLKTLGKTSGENTLFNRVKKAKRQTQRFILDITGSELTKEVIDKQIDKIFWSNNTKFVVEIILIEDGQNFKIVKRV